MEYLGEQNGATEQTEVLERNSGDCTVQDAQNVKVCMEHNIATIPLNSTHTPLSLPNEPSHASDGVFKFGVANVTDLGANGDYVNDDNEQLAFVEASRGTVEEEGQNDEAGDNEETQTGVADGSLRTVTLLTVEGANDNDIIDTPVVKRGRGRPRKEGTPRTRSLPPTTHAVISSEEEAWRSWSLVKRLGAYTDDEAAVVSVLRRRSQRILLMENRTQ